MKIRLSTDLAISNLENLESTIRTMALEIAGKLDTLEKMQKEEQVPDIKAEQTLFTSLQACVRSSSVIVSSASTILSGRSNDDHSTVCESLYGDIFPPNDDVVRWVTNSRIHGIHVRSMSYAASSVKGHEVAELPGYDVEPEQDSDTDLDSELARALSKRGNDQFRDGQYASAEQNFRICLNQLGAVPRGQRARKAKIQRLLIDCMMKQGKWSEARAELQQRLAQHRAQDGEKEPLVLEDLELLVEALRAGNNFAEAQLYGRRLLNEFRALGDDGHTGIQRSLNLLIMICRDEQNQEQEQAYSSMLAVFLEEFSGRFTEGASASTKTQMQIEPPQPQEVQQSVAPCLEARSASTASRTSNGGGEVLQIGASISTEQTADVQWRSSLEGQQIESGSWNQPWESGEEGVDISMLKQNHQVLNTTRNKHCKACLTDLRISRKHRRPS